MSSKSGKLRCHWVSKSVAKSDVLRDPLASIRFRLGAAFFAPHLEISSGMSIPQDVDLVIWPKFSWLNESSSPVLENNLKISKLLQKAGIKQVVDYTDHHLDKSEPPKDGRSDALNSLFMKQADVNSVLSSLN